MHMHVQVGACVCVHVCEYERGVSEYIGRLQCPGEAL